MSYVAIYRREDNDMPITILADARIRQIGTAIELSIGRSKMLFVQIERVGYGYDYYSASAYRVMEVSRDAKAETRD